MSCLRSWSDDMTTGLLLLGMLPGLLQDAFRPWLLSGASNSVLCTCELMPTSAACYAR